MASPCVAGIVNQLINVGCISLWVIDFVTQRGKPGNNQLGQACVPGIGRNSGQTHSFIEIVELVLLIDVEADAIKTQARLIQEVCREDMRLTDHDILRTAWDK